MPELGFPQLRTRNASAGPDEGARGLDAVDDGVLVVGEVHRGQPLHRVHRQLHGLLGGERVWWGLAGKHAGGQADGGEQENNQHHTGDAVSTWTMEGFVHTSSDINTVYACHRDTFDLPKN